MDSAVAVEHRNVHVVTKETLCEKKQTSKPIQQPIDCTDVLAFVYRVSTLYNK